jgi:hypothetical protein
LLPRWSGRTNSQKIGQIGYKQGGIPQGLGRAKEDFQTLSTTKRTSHNWDLAWSRSAGYKAAYAGRAKVRPVWQVFGTNSPERRRDRQIPIALYWARRPGLWWPAKVERAIYTRPDRRWLGRRWPGRRRTNRRRF